MDDEVVNDQVVVENKVYYLVACIIINVPLYPTFIVQVVKTTEDNDLVYKVDEIHRETSKHKADVIKHKIETKLGINEKVLVVVINSYTATLVLTEDNANNALNVA